MAPRLLQPEIPIMPVSLRQRLVLAQGALLLVLSATALSGQVWAAAAALACIAISAVLIASFTRAHNNAMAQMSRADGDDGRGLEHLPQEYASLVDVARGACRKAYEAGESAALDSLPVAAPVSEASPSETPRHMLESARNAFMTTDTSHTITYINPAMRRMLDELAPLLRKSVSTFNPSEVVGADIRALDTVMRNRVEGQEYRELTLGDRRVLLVNAPMRDSDGRQLGAVIEWKDRTAEKDIQEDLRSIVSGVLKGDLSQRITVNAKSSGLLIELSQSVNSLIDTLTDIVSRIQDAATNVNIGANEISRGNADLSARTEQQASGLQETAASMASMTTTVHQNAESAQSANELAADARTKAQEGGRIVADAVDAMSEISTSSDKIAAITGVIDEIAFQTNLLALNAAVEAARAGEQGRGFAVVASEVRNLAGRSAQAAREIKDLIDESARTVNKGTQLVDASGNSLKDILGAVEQVTDIVSGISSATRDQASGIESVNRVVMQMDDLTQQNAALVQQAAAASEALSSQASDLTNMLSRYVQGGTTAVARVAVRTQGNNPATPEPGAPGFTERRGPNRPWSPQPDRASSEMNDMAQGWEEF